MEKIRFEVFCKILRNTFCTWLLTKKNFLMLKRDKLNSKKIDIALTRGAGPWRERSMPWWVENSSWKIKLKSRWKEVLKFGSWTSWEVGRWREKVEQFEILKWGSSWRFNLRVQLEIKLRFWKIIGSGRKIWNSNSRSTRCKIYSKIEDSKKDCRQRNAANVQSLYRKHRYRRTSFGGHFQLEFKMKLSKILNNSNFKLLSSTSLSTWNSTWIVLVVVSRINRRIISNCLLLVSFFRRCQKRCSKIVSKIWQRQYWHRIY